MIKDDFDFKSNELTDAVNKEFTQKCKKFLPKMKFVYDDSEDSETSSWEADIENGEVSNLKSVEKYKYNFINFKYEDHLITERTPKVLSKGVFGMVHDITTRFLFLEDQETKLFSCNYPKDIKKIVEYKLSYCNPVIEIEKFLEFVKDTYGEQYDTLTMKPETFFNIHQRYPAFVEQMQYEGKHVELFSELAKTYSETPSSLEVIGNKILFTDSNDYNQVSGYYFAYGPCAESVVAALAGVPENKDKAPIFSYYANSFDTDNKTNEVVAWSVLRGMPVRVRHTASAVLEFSL